MYFDHQTISTSCGSCHCHRLDKSCDTCCMAWIDDDRQVSHSFQKRNRCQDPAYFLWQFRSCPDASFAKDHIFISASHDVFCAHQQLLQSICKTSLQQDRFSQTADFFQKFEVLHVTGADLDHVYIFEKRQLRMSMTSVTIGSPVFSLASSSRSMPCALIPWNAYGEVLGLNAPPRSMPAPAFLTSSATRQICSSDSTEQGPCDDLKVSSADLYAREDFHHCVFRVEFTVYILVRLLNTLYGFDDIQGVDAESISTAAVSPISPMMVADWPLLIWMSSPMLFSQETKFSSCF